MIGGYPKLMGGAEQKQRRVLVLGATGLIGSAIVARLVADGWAVTAVVRKIGTGARGLPADRLLQLDLAKTTRPGDWLLHLDGVDAVVNSAGALQDGGRDSLALVHEVGPAALFEACERKGIRRVIHISAMGADPAAPTRFARTKGAADQRLEASPLDWVILRPSVIVGRAAYGGSALFRGLASLPLQLRIEGAAPLSVVQLDDVAETVARMLAPEAPARVSFDLPGPQPLSMEQVVANYRHWLGWKPARIVTLPGWLMTIAYRLGDLAGLLGWRAPVRSTTGQELARGSVGDPERWTSLTGIIPRSLDAALAASPASVQERWFARLYLLKPLAFTIFAAFWIVTGILSLTVGYAEGVVQMREGGAGMLAVPGAVGGALADLLIGFAILWRPTTRGGLWAALALSIVYLVAGTVMMPKLWIEPLGPLMKIWPILTLNLFLLAILDER